MGSGETAKLVCLVIGLALMTATGAAFAESAAVTNFKQQVAKIVDTWQKQTSHFNDDLTKAKADLDALNKQTPRPADYDRQLAVIRTRITNDNASIDFATRSAELDLGLLEFKPSNKDESLPLPQFIKDIVKAKGIPLTNNLSVAAPDVQRNWKTNTLGKLIVRFNISTK